MKARMNQPILQRNTGVEVPHKPLKYSVCIITNNAENMIRRTMESLMPLLKAVPGEIIVTDTGCTDKTMDIVHEYTQKTNYFKWCNDFAAARNAGLSIAEGEWFIGIDNDEWFEDVTELIEFFQSDECYKYHSASYVQRNYQNQEGTDYQDFSRLSMARNINGFHYEGLVHEVFQPTYLPCKSFSCYVHHYGYVSKRKEGEEDRINRNVPLLLEQLKKTPDSLHCIYQISNEYAAVKDYTNTILYAKRGLEGADAPKGGKHVLGLWYLLVDSYMKLHDNENAIKYAEQVLQLEKVSVTMRLGMNYVVQICNKNMNNDEKSIEAGKEFIKQSEWLQTSEEGKTEDDYMAKQYTEPRFYESSLRCMSDCYANQSDYENAIAVWYKINPANMLGVEEGYFSLMYRLASESGENHLIADGYDKIVGNTELEDVFLRMLGKAATLYPDKYKDFMKALTSAKTETPYIMMCRLKAEDEQGHEQKAKEILNWFIQNKIECCGIYADVLNYAFKYEADVLSLINLLDMEDWQIYIGSVVSDASGTDMAHMMKYFQSQKIDKADMKQAYWEICLKEAIALNGSFSTKEGQTSAFLEYTEDLISYTHRLYKDDMFTEENLQYLPRVYRFAYNMEQAQKEKEAGNRQGYWKYLKDAMVSYPVIRKPLKMLLDQFEYEQLAEKRHAEEFFELAKQVKAQIEQLITEKKMVQAKQLIEELSTMLPKDEDLGLYRLLVEQATSGQSRPSTQMPQ